MRFLVRYWNVTAICLSTALSGCLALVPDTDPGKVEAPGNMDDAGKSVNAYRAEHGLQPVYLNKKLVETAKQQSSDMQKMRKLVHWSRRGEHLRTRLKKHDYAVCYGAENIAQGYYNDKKVIAAWDKSPSHRRNLLNPHVTEYGMVRVGDYYTLILGGRC